MLGSRLAHWMLILSGMESSEEASALNDEIQQPVKLFNLLFFENDLTVFISDSFVSKPIIFLELPNSDFKELITTPDKFMDNMMAHDVDRFMAHLQYDLDTKPENYLGIGSFKTAAAAKLLFDASHIPLTGLGVQVKVLSKLLQQLS